MRPMIPEMGRCCPGHDKYSSECYENNRSKKAHTEMTKKGHRIMRKRLKMELRNEG